ncbi:MAG: VCBS repeat-containing protein [bacterium]|nr:VCBS repeat-containing protein [bacterium]
MICVAALGCSQTEPPVAETGPTCPVYEDASAGLPDTGEWRTHPSIGDVNGDGLGDISGIARKGNGPHVFLSNGLGEWTDSSEGLDYGTGFSCGIGTTLADWSGDGHLDLVSADHCVGVRVFKGDGTGKWQRVTRGIPTNLEGFNDADVGDIDGDGRMDIVAVSAFHRGFLVMVGRPDDSWRVVENSGLPINGSGWELKLVDMNTDGRLDIVTTFNNSVTERRHAVPPPAKVWIQTAEGKFAPTDGFPEKGRYFGVALRPRNDGFSPDLFFALTGYRAGLHVFESETGQDWSHIGLLDETWYEPGIPRDFIGLDVADLNDDGCLDIVTTEGGSRSVRIAVGDCKGSWALCPLESVPHSGDQPSGWGVTIGDLNGDGRPDLVSGFGDKSRGGLKAWFHTNATLESLPPIQGQTGEVSSVALGSGTPSPEP